EGFNGDDVFNVQAIQGITTVNTGEGTDLVNVSKPVTDTDGTVNAIASALILQGGGPRRLSVTTLNDGSQIDSGTNERQELTVEGLTSQKFELEFDGRTTLTSLAVGASAQDVEDALNALFKLAGAGGKAKVTLAHDSQQPHLWVYTIEFREALGA